jgi:hypothetical protein
MEMRKRKSSIHKRDDLPIDSKRMKAGYSAAHDWKPQDTGRGVRDLRVGGNQWQKPTKAFP